MRPSFNLSESLPVPTDLSVNYSRFSTVPITVGALIQKLELQTFNLPDNVTYAQVARFFKTHPQALGVFITEGQREFASCLPMGMVSRQRVLQWRSHRTLWRTFLNQPLSACVEWWQSICSVQPIAHQTPSSEAMDWILAQDDASAAEPVVIATPDGMGLCDRHALLTACVRWTRAEQMDRVKPTLETLQRQQQLVLDSIGDGVYGIDLYGNATFVNPAAARMVGWEPHELIGKSMHQVLHHSRPDHSPYPREECPIYAAFQDGAVHRVLEEVFWRKDGTHFPVEYISTPMHDECGRLVGAVIAFRDITQRKWAEAILQRTTEELEQRVRDRTIELQQANEQLKELSELRSRVVTMVCHEFRNPLNNILLSVSSLGRYTAQLTPAQKEHYLVGIQENVERMTQMIDAILIIGRVEAKRIEVHPKTFDLIPFCRELVAEASPEATDLLNSSGAGDRLRFTSRCKRLTVTLDPCLLRSILTNILTNALRYTPAPGNIRFRLLKGHNTVTFHITDEGIGIPPEDLPYLFEPFHRGRNVSNIAGTGLGLNIVKRFVDLQGGQVEVSSDLGQGTTFQVTLPMHYVSPKEETTISQSPERTEISS